MNTSKIREAIGLLNSMVLCGEKHSEKSEAVVRTVIDELNKPYDIEFLSEQVHNAWWEEKKRQGFHAPLECPDYVMGGKISVNFKFNKLCDRCHTDCYPYSELPEHIKGYDRVTVRTVLEAIKKMEEAK
jgi:hypothetical protein